MIRFMRYHLGYWARIETIPIWCAKLLDEKEYPIDDERFTSQRYRYRVLLRDGELRYYVKKR